MARTSPFRSERIAALVLLAAALLAVVLANSGVGSTLVDVQHTSFGFGDLRLTAGHWVSDGLLALFFFVAAIELKHELVRGELNSVSKAIRPAIAAVCGVVAPALVYLLIAGPSGFGAGWPIPTATDIAFALGVLALFGRGLIPNRIRIFLLALAIIDDIIAIVIIAIFFTSDFRAGSIGLALVAVVVFGALSHVRGRFRIAARVVMVVPAVAAWVFVHESGVHATIAGVLLGLAMRLGPAMKTRHAMEPIINGVVLPLFAFSAALVVIPDVSIGQLAAPFWAIAIALPLGKVVGIGIGGWIGTALDQRKLKPEIPLFALFTIGALGGIGFTVSLLMNELAFAGNDDIRAEGTLAVLLGSLISMIASAILVSRLALRFRKNAPSTAG